MHCWVCGEDAGFRRLEVRDADRGVDKHWLRLCSLCSSGRLEPSPSRETLDRYYGASYYGSGSGKFAAPLQAIVDLSTRRRARSILGRLHRIPAPLVLDIGCGRGALLGELVSLDARGIGLERAPLDASVARAGVELRVGELTDQRFADASFDAIVLWHAFEHLEDPQAVLAEIGRILKPGGLLVIAVPNNTSWQARVFGSRWFHLDAPRHLHFFGHQGLLRLLRREGYEVLASDTFDPVQNLFGFIQSCLNWLPSSAPNRLYQLMRSGRSPGEILELLLWAMPALLLVPFALVETALSSVSGRGACSIVLGTRGRTRTGMPESPGEGF